MEIKGFLCVALLLAGVISSPASAKDGKSVLNIGIGSEFENLNPLLAGQGATMYILYLTWRPLFVLNGEGKWEATVVKEVPTFKNGLVKKVGSKLEVSVEFIPEAQWGDGTPMTCRDLEFAWKVGRDNNVSLPSRDRYELVEAIVIDPKNPRACRVTMKDARFDFVQRFLYPLPAHLEEPVFEKYRKTPLAYDKNSLYNKNPSHPGLYFGPYVVSEVKLGSHVTLKANPKFHGKKPAIEKIVFRLLPNTGTHPANLKAGTVDMIAPPGGMGLDQAVAFEKAIEKDKLPFKVVYATGNLYQHIDLNQDHPVLSDIRVRKALAHAINKKDLIQSLLHGKAAEAFHLFHPADPWSTKDIPTYPYSPKRANELLEEAGWKKGPDGIRVKDGKRLSLNLLGSAGVKIVETIQVYLQDQWKAVGVEVLNKFEPPRVFFGETLRRRRYDMAIFSWSSVPETSPRGTIHSSSIPEEKNGWTGFNTHGYRSPKVDALIGRLEIEFSPEKRRKIAHQIIRQYAEDLPTIPLFFRSNTTVIPKALKNYRLAGTLYYETLWAEHWSF